MELTIDSIYEGTVTGLTGFGAFVRLSDGQSGMVHISEVSTSFVKDIKEFLTVGQKVKVKVISVSGGKIGLSVRRAEEPAVAKEERQSGEKNVHGTEEKPQSFEDMMAKFKRVSDEKFTDLRRSGDSRYSLQKRQNGNKR